MKQDILELIKEENSITITKHELSNLQVAVFKTNVLEVSQGILLAMMLQADFPGIETNFDLDDCDKVLRIQHNGINPSDIIDRINARGFYCEELKD